jgi:hypothetical protein
MAKDTTKLTLTDYYVGQRHDNGRRHLAATMSAPGFKAGVTVSLLRFDEERDGRDGTDGIDGTKSTRTPIQTKFLAVPTLGKRDTVSTEGVTIRRFACRKAR